MDNAIEASSDGQTILLSIYRDDNGLCVSVSNPHEALSGADFLQMFKLGYTTKTTDNGARGYGLSNVRHIAEKYHGKIITKNETVNEINHVTFGIVFP
jgi:sensor histidine kinase regulating citrate/malate metabolism